MKPDYQRIAELEYDLGYTDKQPYYTRITDAPGSVITYSPIPKELYAPCTGPIAEPSPQSPSTGTPSSTSS